MAPTAVEFRKVLVAYDGSKDSEKSIQFASALSSKFGAELILAHTYAPIGFTYGVVGGTSAAAYKAMEESAKEGAKKRLADGLAISKKSGGKARGVLLEGLSTVQTLVEYAEDNKVDLIVVGTRGMTGFKKLVMGSVSSGIVTHASCPVLVVR